MAATRLRKSFKYPDDSEGSDVSHDELDEEEQEKLVSDLRQHEAEDNARYILVFASLPLTVILPYLYYLFSSTRSVALLCLLAITSLLSTAYTMYSVPIEAPKSTKFKRTFPATSADGPIDKYLPYLNSAISLLLCVSSWALKAKESAPEGLWLFLLLPAVVLLMITVARKSMVDIQAGIGELDGMKYGYKGA